MNYNFFVDPFSSDAYRHIMQVITTYIHYSAGADELVQLGIGSILNNNFFVNPFCSDAYRHIMQVITTYIHYSAGADELAIIHGDK